MRLPLPIVVFFMILAGWGGWAIRHRDVAAVDQTPTVTRPSGQKHLPIAQPVSEPGDKPVSEPGDKPVFEPGDTSPLTSILHTPVTWAAAAAILGLGLIFFTGNRSVPARLDQTIADVLHALPQGVVIVDRTGRILAANVAASRLTGIITSRLISRNIGSLRWLRSRHHRIGDPWQIATESPLPVPTQWMRYEVDSGVVRTLAVTATTCVHPPDPQTFRARLTHPCIVVTLADVTDMERRADDRERMVAMLKQDGVKVRRHNRRLKQLASTDPLTGCLNRRQFFGSFEKVWQNPRIRRQGLTVLMIDNDRFKRLNDTYGHAVGDEVLRLVSAFLRKALPEPALVCRYGGEEFCVLLPNCKHGPAMEIAEMLRIGVGNLRVADQPSIQITVSIGVATLDQDNAGSMESPVQMIATADRRLYQAKNAGRDRVQGAPPP